MPKLAQVLFTFNFLIKFIISKSKNFKFSTSQLNASKLLLFDKIYPWNYRIVYVPVCNPRNRFCRRSSSGVTIFIVHTLIFVFLFAKILKINYIIFKKV